VLLILTDEKTQADIELADAERERATAEREATREKRKEMLKNAARAAGAATGAAVMGIGRTTANGIRAIANYTSYNMFILFALLIHFVKWGLNFDNSYTWQIDIAFALIVLFFFFNKENRTAEIWRGVFIVCLLEIFLPTLLGINSSIANNDYVRLYLLNRILTPWWLYYALAIAGSRTKLSLWLKRFLIFFWIGVLITTVPAVTFTNLKASYAGPEQMQAAAELWTRSVNFYKNAGSAMVKGVKSIPQLWQKQLDIATGGYYTGKVDENQKEPLGVYIETLKTSAPEFYMDEKPSIYATLRVKTLDDGILVKPYCYSGEKDSNGNYAQDENKKGIPYPQNISRIYDLERQDIECIYSTTSFKEGGNKVTMQVGFNFETQAYLKTYFMDKDRIRSMVTQNLDPLKQYGITDIKPIAKYTNGPVMIGIGFSEPPIGIASNNERNLRVGITLESNSGWEGKINEIKELVIQLPDSLALDLKSCTHSFILANTTNYVERCTEGYRKFRTKQFMQCRAENNLEDYDFDESGNLRRDQDGVRAKFDECMKSECKKEYEGYNSYYLDVSKNSAALRNIERFKTFTCGVTVLNAQNLLGSSPVSTKYIRAKARYDYSIEKSTTINMKVIKDPITGTMTTIGTTYVVPKTDVEVVRKVYNNYYNMPPQPIKTYVDKYKGESDKLSYCLVAGIISQESKGNPLAVNSVSQCTGLMQLSPRGTAQEVATKLNLNYNYDMLFDPATNINMGTSYISDRLKQYSGTNDPIGYALASYNTGMGNVNILCSGSKSTTPTIPFKDCLPKLAKETQNYVPGVLKYKQACEELALEKIGTIKEEVNKVDIFGSGSVSIPADLSSSNNNMLLSTGGSNKISVKLFKESSLFGGSSTEPSYSLDLYYGTLYLFKGLTADKKNYISNPKYPFVRFRQTANNLEYLYFKNSVINVKDLEANGKLSTGEKRYSEVWNNSDGTPYIYAWYDGNNLILYDKDKKSFCTAPLTELDSRCNEDVPNILIRTIEKNTENKKASVQIEYDPSYKAPCCPNSCEKDKDKQSC
jgi:soluble lytic murein transglycosylase